MFWNIVLALAVALVTGALAGLGGHLASTERWHKWAFWGGGLVVWILIGLQTYRNEVSQQGLQAQLDKIQHNTEQPQPAPIVNVNPPTVNMNTPPRHTHISYLGIGSPPNDPVIPLREGQDLATQVGFRNSGDFEVESSRNGAIVAVVLLSEPLDHVWKRLSPKIEEKVQGGVLPVNRTGDSTIQYYTFRPDHPLTKDELDGLTSQPPKAHLCVLGKVQWKDETGSYETDCMQCIAHESDGSYNVHVPPRNDREHKLGN